MLEEMVAGMELTQIWCPMVDTGFNIVEQLVFTTIDST
jgi:hypothetical protein